MLRRDLLLNSGLLMTSLLASRPFAALGAGSASDAEIDRTVEAVMRENHVPGLAACLVDRSHVLWSKSWGWSDIEARIPQPEPLELGDLQQEQNFIRRVTDNHLTDKYRYLTAECRDRQSQCSLDDGGSPGLADGKSERPSLPLLEKERRALEAQLVQEAERLLPPSLWYLLRRKYLEQATLEELAQELGTSKGTIGTRLMRAREKLKANAAFRARFAPLLDGP